MPREGPRKHFSITVLHKDNPKEYYRQWRELHPDYELKRKHQRKDKDWRIRYGISRADYERMLTDQSFGCAICGVKESGCGREYFNIDHDHVTGSVRGLLCDLCNRGLGFFKDSIENLSKAIDYLEKAPKE